MDLKQLQKQTVAIDKRFPHHFDKVSLALDITEEVGELAQAILIVEKTKLTNDPKKKRTVEDVANGLGDIMFDLLVMAEKYGLDMETEYTKVMAELAARIQKGEFGTKAKKLIKI